MLSASAADLVADAFASALRPDPLLTVSEWADAHRMLSQKASAEPGRYRSSRTPYLREIMDCLSPSSKVEEVVFMKGAQVGGSEAGNNWIAYVIDYAPGPMILVQPTLKLANDYSKQRIKSLIEETPRLSEKILEEGENSVLSKEFKGGMLKIAGANSAASLCSMPARYGFFDEIDRWPDDCEGEGDPISLVEARARTFARKKKFKVSTPTVKKRSKIEKAYLRSDQRRYHVPCPHCGELQELLWPQLRFDQIKVGEELEPANVRYICAHCSGEISEHHKTRMLEQGRWVATNPGAGGGLVAGFHLSALYSPMGWYSWEQAARDFLKAHKKMKEGDASEMKGFVNTVKGESWEETGGDVPEWERLYERREPYPEDYVPREGVFLTAGVDVQKDRLECEVVAWGHDRQSWSIGYYTFDGDVMTETPWRALDRLLGKVWPHASGAELPIRMMAIDTSYQTQRVYNWVRRYSLSRVMALKGSHTASLMLGAPSTVDVTTSGRRIRRGLKLWLVGVGIVKSELYAWLKLPKPLDGEGYRPGYCHFPERSDEYFKQLTAEQLVVRIVRGYPTYLWEKTRDRNEALDCRVYARVAAAAVGLDRWDPEQWEEEAASLGSIEPAAEPPPGPQKPRAPAEPEKAELARETQASSEPDPDPPPRRRSSSFWKGR